MPDINPERAIADLHEGFAVLSGLAVSYFLSVMGAIVLIIVGWMAAGFVERAIYGGLGSIHGFDVTLRAFLAGVARYVILALTLVMVLGQFGVQTASIVAAIGAVGLAIGLALQGTLQNIAAGIMLLVLRPFRIGEDIEVGAVAGTIEEIGLFATRLRTSDGIYILAPNSTLWNQPVRNYTRNGVRRTDITVSIPPGPDIEAVRDAFQAIADRDRRVRPQPPPAALVSAFGEDNKVVVTLRFWTSAEEAGATRFELSRAMERILADMRPASEEVAAG